MGYYDPEGLVDSARRQRLLDLYDRATPEGKEFILVAAVSVACTGPEKLAWVISPPAETAAAMPGEAPESLRRGADWRHD